MTNANAVNTAELRAVIASHYDGSHYETISALYNRNGDAWQLFKLEETVECQGKQYFCVIIEKYNYDVEDIDCLLNTETIFEKYVEL